MTTPAIRLRGAREHNLKDVDLDLPVGGRVALAGVSGSGKSSLAFDTIAREGLRRFLETLAASEPGASDAAAARLGRLSRPEVDSIEGLPAVVAVGQGDWVAGPRTTLGTVSGVTPALRVLLAQHGEAFCPRCGKPRPRRTTAQLVVEILERRAGRMIRVMAPVKREREALEALPERGVLRAWLREEGSKEAGREIRLDEPFELPAGAPHSRLQAFAVADRLAARPEHAGRLAEAAEHALDLGSGVLAIEDGGAIERHATSRGCPDCGVELPAVSPGALSSSAPLGACARCRGAGAGEEGAECAACGGSGLSPFARSVRLDGRSLADLEALEVAELRAWTEALRLPDTVAARELRVELATRLAALDEVGLGALALRRRAQTLSTGEARRAHLAAALGARVRGALFVLDEPTVGCHPADRVRLLARIDRLRDAGNTVLVVEHDADVIRSSDWVVELGPGAGPAGGRVVAQGTPEDLLRRFATPTAAALAGRLEAAPPRAKRPLDRAIRVAGARLHNLQGVDASFALGALTVVAGVSGSGKSSLVFGALADEGRRLASAAKRAARPLVARVVEVGPRLPPRNARSSPATYLGVAAVLRELFAATPSARARGFTRARFSANRGGDPVEAGRCEACAGLGFKTIELDLLETVTVACEVCRGARFSAATLEIRWKGKSFAEVLDLSIADAAAELAAVPKIARALAPAGALGLGYLRLGERADVLSGGELQRLQIARELARAASGGPALVLLDEPTRGLHAVEIAALVAALRRMADRGDAVVVVEHAMEVVRAADHVVELGPGSGREGGRVVAEGAPDVIAAAATATGRALRGELSATTRPARAAGTRADGAIRVKGARARNLAGVDAEFPHGRWTAVAGPAGSGKTTLALDVVAAEGRRRFLSALAVAERRALERVDPPQADAVEGVGATVALRDLPDDVAWGEAAGLLPLLRAWFARRATPGCPQGHGPLETRSAESLAEEALARFEGRRARVVTRLPSDAGASFARRARELRARGFARVLVNGDEQRLEDAKPGARDAIDLVVDRLELSAPHRARLLEALEEAAAAGDGRAALVVVGEPARLEIDRQGRCLVCGARLARSLRPSDFAAATLDPFAAAATLEGVAWPAPPGWTLRSLDALAKSSAPAAAALRERARLAGTVIGRDVPLSATGLAEGRAAWIACAAGTAPTGATVVVDDPTRGLARASAEGLLRELRKAAGGARTLVTAGADPRVAALADHVVALGPLAKEARLAPRARARTGSFAVAPAPPEIAGLATSRDVVRVGLGARARVSPAQALGVLAPIAALYARTPEARLAGFTAARFDFTASGSAGRCSLCRGRGWTWLDLEFLPGELATCVACGGARYEPRTLGVRLYGRTIAETLALTIGEAARAFADHRAIAAPLEAAASIGLGAIALGRPGESASPSELARLELANALAREPERTALVAAKATDGLHGEDLERVVGALQAFADRGGAVVLVDPREELLAAADVGTTKTARRKAVAP